MAVSLNDFTQETECVYKGEHYLVRDNGAVLRRSREGMRSRPADNQWTFGKPNKSGYMEIASVSVHRIVATAFHNDPPTKEHVVDHRDTNRRNNRPENLRWLTRLENILNNPFTRKKIIFLCGSLEAFLADPSILRNYTDKDPNFSWMRTVTPEEAQITWKRLSEWSEKENENSSARRGSMGEWIYADHQNTYSIQEPSEWTPSETPNAIQKNWNTPTSFPCCPQGSTNQPIQIYFAHLRTSEIFSRNKYLHTAILDFALSGDGKTLCVLCQALGNSIKPWLLASVTYENNLFVHSNIGSFFTRIGAEKQFTLAQGLEWTGEDSIDDEC